MMPAKPLVVLTMAVVAMHALLLQPGVQAVESATPQAQAFLMRTVGATSPAAVTALPRGASAAPGTPAAPAAHVTHAASTLRDAPKTPASPAAQIALQASAVIAQTTAVPVAPAPASAPAAPPAPAAAVSIPGPVRLHYRVQMQRGGLRLDGQGELQWRHDGQSYEARLELSAPLVRTRTQHSAGRITADGLAPLRFADKSRNEEAAHFDRDKGKLSFSSNRPDVPLVPGMQDRLSVLIQVAALVAGDPAKYPPGASISVPTAGTREAEPWVFVVEGPEELELPGGKVPALKLTRSPRKEFDLKVELWLAPGMDYVPVRLRLTQPNGDSVDQQWSSTDRG